MRVIVTNQATNIPRSSVTNERGLYVVPFLPPGAYTVTAERDGFKRATRSGLLLRVSDQLTVDIALELGGIVEQVTVVGGAPLVNTVNPSLGQVIENRRIVDLPLNGREPFSLATLAPGVLPPPTTGLVHLGGAVPSINGAANFTSEVTVDGMPNTTPRNSGRNNFLIYTPSVDAVAEFKVETNSLSAEFGRFNGGVISVVTKSGTNEFHGTLYEFHRNSAMDSNSFFNNRAGIPLGALRRNQFGATAGGPLLIPAAYNGRNRTFFFGDYEGFRESQLAISSSTVPTALQRRGDFSATTTNAGAPILIYDPATTQIQGNIAMRLPFAGNLIPAARINTVAAKLTEYYPQPSNARVVGNLDQSASRFNRTDSGDARLDHNWTDLNRMFVRFSIQNPYVGEPNFFGNVGNFSNPPLTQYRRAFTLQDTHTFSPTLILNLNYGLAHMFGTRRDWSDGFDVTNIGLPANYRDAQQVRALPVVSIAGMTGVGNGVRNYSTQLSHTVQGSLSKIAGAHALKFGADWRTYYINQLQNTRASGTMSFSQAFTQGPNGFQASPAAGFGFATFLLGIPSGTIATQPAVATKSSYTALFMQDDWRLTRKLTVNLGFRHDLNFPRTERYDRMSVFDLNAASPIAGRVAGYPNLRGAMLFRSSNDRALTALDGNNFAPRFGFAFSLRPNTTLRGGYGIFYGLSATDASGPSGGFTDGFIGVTDIVTSLNGVTPIVSLSNPYPNGTNRPLSRDQLTSVAQIGQTHQSAIIGLATPYFQNWNFSVQQGLGANLLIEAAYAANKGTKTSQGSVNLNALTADQRLLGAVNNQLVANPFFGVITDATSPLSQPTVTRGQLIRPYPQYLDFFAVFPAIGNSIYHSFQMRVEKRFSKGFTLLGALTVAKAIDDTNQDGVGPSTGIQDPANLRLERSLDPQDISRRLVLSGVWELPNGRGRWLGNAWPHALDMIAGGWQVNGIASFQSGYPLVVSSTGAPRPNRVSKGRPVTGAIQSNLNAAFDTSAFAVPAAFTYGNSSRTAPDLRTHGVNNFDLSLFKYFQLYEKMRAQLRFESFNAFNRVQFAAPGTQTGTANFGVITGQANAPR
ncbi:MAG: TonB-dependent receptor domain-containing protein, partial [Bryobacteraceae bacterium]